MGIFLDLNEKLLIALEKGGVRGEVLQLFRNYLTNRQQKVKIRDVLSDPQTIQMGVPQEIWLSPILFIIYINSLLGLEVDGRIITYADEIVLFFHRKYWEKVKKKAVSGILKVKKMA